MKVTLLLMFFLVISNCFAQAITTPFRSGGGMDGAGGDFMLNMGVYPSAWFTNNETVQICIIKSSSFSIHNDELKRSIEWAYSTWQKYLMTKNVYDDFAVNMGVAVSTNIQFVDSCNKASIKFIFGKVTPQVSKFKKKFTNPVAFAQPLTLNKQLPNLKGIIWIAPDESIVSNVDGSKFPNWKNLELFRATLLHEIGHVLGCGHIQGTIMDEHIMLTAFISSSMADQIKINKIDLDRELITCLNCGYSLTGSISGGDNSNDLIIIKTLFNEPHLSTQKVELLIEPSTNTHPKQNGRLKFTNDHSSYEASLELHKKTASIDTKLTQIFYVDQIAGFPYNIGLDKHYSASINGYLKTNSGKKYLIEVEINKDPGNKNSYFTGNLNDSMYELKYMGFYDSYLRIHIFINGKRMRLFGGKKDNFLLN